MPPPLTAPARWRAEGREDSWRHSAAAGVDKSSQLGQGGLTASQLCKQTAVWVHQTSEHRLKSKARIFT